MPQCVFGGDTAGIPPWESSVGLEAHRAASPPSLAAYVVTFSDSRDEQSDTTGAQIREALAAAGHRVMGWCIWREDAEVLRQGMQDLLNQGGFDVVIVNGGTGIAPRDLAYDVLAGLYEREIPGFGELFRTLSYAEIGSAAMLSRASAGIARGVLVFSLPGSRGAARLAMDKLILPELGHLAGELRRAPERERRS